MATRNRIVDINVGFNDALSLDFSYDGLLLMVCGGTGNNGGIKMYHTSNWTLAWSDTGFSKKAIICRFS